MGQAEAAIEIGRPAADVWAIVADFGGLGEWMPGIESCKLEGEDRILSTLGMELTEHLVSKDDEARALTYSIVSGVPVDHHQATISVQPTGDGCHVTWAVDVLPEEMVEVMRSTYQQALEALKSRVEA